MYFQVRLLRWGRGEDVPLLAQYFVDRYTSKAEIGLPEVRPSARVPLHGVRKASSARDGDYRAALAECNGCASGPRGAGVKLGIPQSTLDSKIKSLKINKQRFRRS